jgi:hypothetical protein
MRSCPETEKIRALRSGSLTEEEASSLKNHAAGCPVCRQELRIEDEIDLELARDFTASGIENEVLRELEVIRLMEKDKNGRGTYRYLLLAALTAVLGFLVIPYPLRLPPIRLGPLFAPDRLMPLVEFVKSNPLVVIVAGNVLIAVSLFMSYPRFRKALSI